jgi:hypothetical protein
VFQNYVYLPEIGISLFVHAASKKLRPRTVELLSMVDKNPHGMTAAALNKHGE